MATAPKDDQWDLARKRALADWLTPAALVGAMVFGAVMGITVSLLHFGVPSDYAHYPLCDEDGIVRFEDVVGDGQAVVAAQTLRDRGWRDIEIRNAETSGDAVVAATCDVPGGAA